MGGRGVATGAAVEGAEAWLMLRWSRRRRAAVGAEAMVGAEAVVVDGVWVRVAGERWRARDHEGREPGEIVEVRAVEGLRSSSG